MNRAAPSSRVAIGLHPANERLGHWRATGGNCIDSQQQLTGALGSLSRGEGGIARRVAVEVIGELFEDLRGPRQRRRRAFGGHATNAVAPGGAERGEAVGEQIAHAGLRRSQRPLRHRHVQRPLAHDAGRCAGLEKAEGPHGEHGMHARRRLGATAVRVAQIIRDREPHGVARAVKAGGGLRRPQQLGEHALRPQDGGTIAHGLGDLALERRIVDAAGIPWFRRHLHTVRAAARHHLPLLPSEHGSQHVAAQLERATGTLRILHSADTGQRAGHVVRPCRPYGAVVALVPLRRQLARLALPLRAFHQAAIGECGEVVGRQGGEVGTGHLQRTFSATHAASSPGVMAPTCAPRPAMWPAVRVVVVRLRLGIERRQAQQRDALLDQPFACGEQVAHRRAFAEVGDQHDDGAARIVDQALRRSAPPGRCRCRRRAAPS